MGGQSLIHCSFQVWRQTAAAQQLFIVCLWRGIGGASFLARCIHSPVCATNVLCPPPTKAVRLLVPSQPGPIIHQRSCKVAPPGGLLNFSSDLSSLPSSHFFVSLAEKQSRKRRDALLDWLLLTTLGDSSFEALFPFPLSSCRHRRRRRRLFSCLCICNFRRSRHLSIFSPFRVLCLAIPASHIFLEGCVLLRNLAVAAFRLVAPVISLRQTSPSPNTK